MLSQDPLFASGIRTYPVNQEKRFLIWARKPGLDWAETDWVGSVGTEEVPDG